jgi:hypothetical protein
LRRRPESARGESVEVGLGSRLGVTVRFTVAGVTSWRCDLTMCFALPACMTVRIMLVLRTVRQAVIGRPHQCFWYQRAGAQDHRLSRATGQSTRATGPSRPMKLRDFRPVTVFKIEGKARRCCLTLACREDGPECASARAIPFWPKPRQKAQIQLNLYILFRNL